MVRPQRAPQDTPAAWHHVTGGDPTTRRVCGVWTQKGGGGDAACSGRSLCRRRKASAGVIGALLPPRMAADKWPQQEGKKVQKAPPRSVAGPGASLGCVSKDFGEIRAL